MLPHAVAFILASLFSHSNCHPLTNNRLQRQLYQPTNSIPDQVNSFPGQSIPSQYPSSIYQLNGNAYPANLNPENPSSYQSPNLYNTMNRLSGGPPLPLRAQPLPSQNQPLPLQAPPVPQQAPPLPPQNPPVPPQAPPVPQQALPLPPQNPPVPPQKPSLPLQHSPLPPQAPPLLPQAPPVSPQDPPIPPQAAPVPPQAPPLPPQAPQSVTEDFWESHPTEENSSNPGASNLRRKRNVPEQRNAMVELMEKGKELLSMSTVEDIDGEVDEINRDISLEGGDGMPSNVTVIPIPRGIQLKTASIDGKKHVNETVNITSSTHRALSAGNSTEIENVIEMRMEKKIEDEKGVNRGSEAVHIVETERIKPVAKDKWKDLILHTNRRRNSLRSSRSALLHRSKRSKKASAHANFRTASKKMGYKALPSIVRKERVVKEKNFLRPKNKKKLRGNFRHHFADIGETAAHRHVVVNVINVQWEAEAKHEQQNSNRSKIKRGAENRKSSGESAANPKFLDLLLVVSLMTFLAGAVVWIVPEVCKRSKVKHTSPVRQQMCHGRRQEEKLSTTDDNNYASDTEDDCHQLEWQAENGDWLSK